MTFDKNCVGYINTGGRYDIFKHLGYSCIVDTTTMSTSNWMSHNEAKNEVIILNSNDQYYI